MMALLKAMDERRTIHDFSQLKNLLTSATEMLRMDPKTVHTTPHVRPSVCDVLFDVSLPGLNTMLAAQALLRSSSPSNALSAIITCLTPKVNPFCSLSEAEEVYRRQLDTLSSAVGVRDLLPDDIQVLLWAAILAQLDPGHVSSWGQAYLAYQKSVLREPVQPTDGATSPTTPATSQCHERAELRLHGTPSVRRGAGREELLVHESNIDHSIHCRTGRYRV